mgnify:CR=1 FL=1
MKKRIILISLIVLLFFGGFVNFYTTNFVLSDVSNLTYGITNRPEGIFASLSGLNFSFLLVLVSIFLIRYLRRPQYIKRMSRLYVIIGMSFSLIGLVSAVLAGILVYQSFTKSNPFPGYLILSIVVFSLLLVAGTLFFILVYPKMKEDTERREIKAGYVVYSIFLSVTIFYAYNRFGAFLWSPKFIDWPTFNLTWFYYLGLIFPALMYVHTFLYSFDFYKKHNKEALIIISIIATFFLANSVYVIWLGCVNSTFISVISPAMGASRLLALPIDIVMHIVVFGVLAGYALRHSIIYYKKHKVSKISE